MQLCQVCLKKRVQIILLLILLYANYYITYVESIYSMYFVMFFSPQLLWILGKSL